MLTPILTLAGLVLYLAAAGMLLQGMRRGRGPRNPAALVVAALAGPDADRLFHGRDDNAVLVPGGLDLAFFQALSLAVWVLVLLMLVLTPAHPMDTLGVGLFPLAALTLALGLAFDAGAGAPTIPTEGTALDAHVLISICAHGVLGLAAMQAVLLGFQHRLLHRRQPLRAVQALPPLYAMESMLFRLIATGFVLLTAALATGFLYLEGLFAQQLVHKTVLTIAAWVLFGVLLAGHHWAGWRGPTAVRFTVGGFVLLVLGYFGSKLVIELVLAPS